MNGRTFSSSAFCTFDREYMKSTKVLTESYKYIYIDIFKKYVWMFVYDCLFCQQIYSQHELNWCYPQYYSEHAPTLELWYDFMCFKAEKKPSILAFVASESKSNLTMFPTFLVNKLLCRDVSF